MCILDNQCTVAINAGSNSAHTIRHTHVCYRTDPKPIILQPSEIRYNLPSQLSLSHAQQHSFRFNVRSMFICPNTWCTTASHKYTLNYTFIYPPVTHVCTKCTHLTLVLHHSVSTSFPFTIHPPTHSLTHIHIPRKHKPYH